MTTATAPTRPAVNTPATTMPDFDTRLMLASIGMDVLLARAGGQALEDAHAAVTAAVAAAELYGAEAVALAAVTAAQRPVAHRSGRIGQALLENAVYDQNGQLVTASYMDYAMPRAEDLPTFKIGHTTTLCPGNPLGIKGCGEAGAIGSSAAVINAITDAIGNNNLEMPASPDRVWHAIQARA